MTEAVPGVPEKPKEPPTPIEDDQTKTLAYMAEYLGYMLRPASERPRITLMDEGVIRVQLTNKEIITFELRFPTDFPDEVQQKFLDHPYKDHALQLGVSLAISAQNHHLISAQEGEQNAATKPVPLAEVAERFGIEPIELFYAYNTAWAKVLMSYVERRDKRWGYGSTLRRRKPAKSE